MIEEHQVEIGELFKLANQAGVRPEYIIGPVFYFTGEKISPNMEMMTPDAAPPIKFVT